MIEIHNMKLGLILLLNLVVSFSFGQEYFGETREIGMEEGLSHYKVLAFYPENNGMWIGTDEGLNFYDGYNWKYWSKEKGQLSRREVNFIHKDQGDFLWLFNAKKIDERKHVRSIDILSVEKDSTFSFEQKFGKHAPFEIKDIQNFYQDQQKQLFFFAKKQLWKYTPSHLFQLVELPQNFKPYSILSDDYLVGEINGKLSLISPQGELLFISDYSLNDSFFNIVGTNQKFWVWQDQSTAEVFERLPSGKYQSILFPLQQNKGVFYFLFYDKIKNQVWVNKDKHIYLFDKNENQLFKQETMARVACMDKDRNLWT
ncbi:MAG: hypothetical protein AB8H03_18640, partial [Saprospiraceae bacterium]